MDAGSSGDTQPAGMGSAMLPMLFLLLMMMSLMMFPGMRNSLSDGAGTVIEPFLFGTLGLEQYFVPTVFILGSSNGCKYGNTFFFHGSFETSTP